MTTGGGEFNIKWAPASDGLDGRFEEVYIRAELWERGKDTDFPMEVTDILVEPKGIIDVDIDASRSTPETVVLRAELSDKVLADEEFYDKVARPVHVEVVARPIAEQTAAAITAGSIELRRKCTIGVDVPEARIHWRDLEHPEAGDDCVIEVEADGEDEVQLEVWLERYIPAKRTVTKDESVYFSHMTGPMFRPRIFGAHPDSLPWVVAQPGSGNRRDKSRWKSNAVLPDSRHPERLPIHGHIRVRAWGPQDIVSRSPNDIDPLPGRRPQAEQKVPIHLVPVKVGVRKIAPLEPVPADDSPVEVELEFYRVRTGELLKHGEVSWKLREGARYPGGSFDVESHVLEPADNGRARFAYTVPRKLYEPGKAWDQDLDVFLGSGEARQQLPGVVLFVSPEIRAHVSAEKKGLDFEPPYELVIAAHLAPCEIVGHCGFVSLSPDLPDQLDVYDAKPHVTVICESGEQEVVLDTRTGKDGTYTWFLPELAPGLEGLPEGRRKVTLRPFEEESAGDLDEKGQELTKGLLTYVLRSEATPILGRLLGSTETERVKRQPMVMARQLCEQAESEWERAHQGTRIVHMGLRGAVAVDGMQRGLFERALDLIVKFLFDALEYLIKVKKFGEKILNWLADTRIAKTLGPWVTWAFGKLVVGPLRGLRSVLATRAPRLAGAIDKLLDAVGGTGSVSSAISSMAREAEKRIMAGAAELIQKAESAALSLLFSESSPLTQEALTYSGKKAIEKGIKEFSKKMQKILSKAGEHDYTYQELKDELRGAFGTLDDTVRKVTRLTTANVDAFTYPNDPNALATYLGRLGEKQREQVALDNNIAGVDEIVSTIDLACDLLAVAAVAATILSAGTASIVTFPALSAITIPKLMGKLAVHAYQGFQLMAFAIALESVYEQETMHLTDPGYQP